MPCKLSIHKLLSSEMLFDCKLIDTTDSKCKGTVNLMRNLSERTNTEYESDMVYAGNTALLLHYPSVKAMLSGRQSRARLLVSGCLGHDFFFYIHFWCASAVPSEIERSKSVNG
jgi:hypothetical protein